ncbi:MAG TPA: UDP-N-acetylglucosamine 2-epimerase (non-hydrolyzing) [Gaiellales bacterium]|nr:UDP-N-acetylglucosamine 2-epimerase (non-hydrolyzing) [Gaiellales bacterium]
MRIVSIVGNRPQFIKAAPVAAALDGLCDHALVHTGQHYDAGLSQIFFEELGLRPADRVIESGSGSHAEQTARMLMGLEPVIEEERPDAVLVYGDTNSTLAGALVSAKLHVPIAHVEAGLRSFDRRMPEELNRMLVDVLSDLRFCPSDTAVTNLAAEGMTTGVHLVGDVMVDVATTFAPIAARRSDVLARVGVEPGGYVVLTAHRPANTLPETIPRLVEVIEAVGPAVVFPVHPRTRAALERAGLLGRAEAAAHLTPPLGYLDFTALLMSAAACLTDSGGVQKEAYLHSVPCITLRDTSEWVETIAAGWNRLVDLDPAAVTAALASAGRPAEHPPLYGDGAAAGRIAAVITAGR